MTNEQAFPLVSWKSPDGMTMMQYQAGLTKREWFAGMALASIPLRSWDTETYGNDFEKIKAWARCAYLVADAMLEPPTGNTK